MFQFGIQLSEIKALRKGFCNPAPNEKRAKFTIMTHAPLLDRPCFYIGHPGPISKLQRGPIYKLIQSYMGVLMDLEIIYSFATCFRFGLPVCMMGENFVEIFF